ncbi:MAG: iron-containing redox enzyme family protein [Proteobacteria bacterium]|nr:iron-containing redox enzyme family protein [Pseudomonadota bacterium]
MQGKSLSINYKDISALGYDYVQEKTYTADHPEVVAWSNAFLTRFREKQIFEAFEAYHSMPSLVKAKVVGTQWHRFSDLMPYILCAASAKVSNNRLRHYTIQTAYEELGARNSDEIHHEMFWQTAVVAGVNESDRQAMSDEAEVSSALNYLKQVLAASKSDEEILGLLLGLEICAEENIETVFSSLAHSKKLELNLAETKFFKLHRQLEMEHIRLDISIYLRFCQTSIEKTRLFTKGFDSGVEFWAQFWSGVGKITVRQQHEVATRA